MKAITIVGSSMLALMPAVLQAQDMNSETAAVALDADAEEIVVTGGRLREESVQETPIAVAVLSAQQVENLNGSNLIALSGKIPNLTVTTLGTTPSAPVISLRGFQTAAADISIEPGVPVSIDGVYQSMNSGSLADLFDVERVEVLRGPQGTTLGKNASAGAVLITRSRPTGDLGGRAQIEYGTFNLVQAQGLLNFPIVDGTLAGKVYASFRRRDNYVENLTPGGEDMSGEKRGSVRGALLFTPSDSSRYYLTADYIWDRSRQRGGRNVALPRDTICIVFRACTPNTAYQTTQSQFSVRPTVDDINVTGVGDFAFGGAKLSSITGYRDFDEFNANDLDKTAFPALEVLRADTRLKQFSQELRLTSEEGEGLDLDGRLAWLVAAYYNRGRASQIQAQNVFGTRISQSQKSNRDSYALFGRADFNLTDSFILSGGVRHSWDKTTHLYSLPVPGLVANAPSISESRTFENTSFEAGAQYRFAPEKMIYLRYAEGYRGGGFAGTPSAVINAVSFNPETSESYEVGLKTESLGGAFLFNTTLFRTKFKDLQKQVGRTGSAGNLLQTIDNAANSVVQGIEIESVLRPTRGFSVNISGGYLDAKYKSYLSRTATGAFIDLSSTPFQFAPKFAGSVAPEYVVDLDGGAGGFETISFGGRLTFTAEYEISSTVPPSPVGHQEGYSVVDLNVDLTRGPLRLGAYVSNLFDKRYLVYGNEPANLIAFQIDNIGRVFGVKAGLRF